MRKGFGIYQEYDRPVSFVSAQSSTWNGKYARLSYFRQPKSRYRWGYRRSRYSHARRPWDYLPDKNCFRKRCRSRYDCCKRYSNCDTFARICYDCWYGHPCSASKDCCLRFPNCNAGMCTE